MEFCLQNNKKAGFNRRGNRAAKNMTWQYKAGKVIRKAVMYDDYSLPRILKKKIILIIHDQDNAAPDTVPQTEEEDLNLDAIEKRYILKAYEKYKGKISDMEKALGVSKNTVKDKLTEYGVDYKKKV